MLNRRTFTGETLMALRKQITVFKCRIFFHWWRETDLFGADERGHDAHVRRQEELQTHDEDGQDSEGHQLQTVIHQLQGDKFTLGLITENYRKEV